MLIKPFSSIIAREREMATMSYLGTVEDNKDPEKRGRVKVYAAPYENMTTEELPWACRQGDPHGNSPDNAGLNVPEIGSQVRIYFPNQDMTAPYYTGAELNDINRSTFFDENYPNTYGYKDSKGNFMKINKEKETIHLQHSSTSNVKVSPEGSMQVELSNGSYFSFQNTNSFDLNLKNVIIYVGGGDLTIEATSSVTVKTNSFNVIANEEQSSKPGVSGTFWAMGHLVTVTNGLITSIEGFINANDKVKPKVDVQIDNG